jgi:hypothetical protein
VVVVEVASRRAQHPPAQRRCTAHLAAVPLLHLLRLLLLPRVLAAVL